jgi:predicted ATP-grasp superfamily ATP-dependent carboligase
MTSTPLPVVIGLGVNGYGILRSLARVGASPFGLALDDQEFGSRSRLLEGTGYFRDDSAGADLREALQRLHVRTGRTLVLFPTSDELVAGLTLQREALVGFCRYHWNPEVTLRLATDKTAMGELCESLGIHAPKTEQPLDQAGVDTLAGRLGFPAIVKPRSGGDMPFRPGQKNAVVSTSEELVTLYRNQPELLGHTLCQEIVAGPDSDIFQVTALMPAGEREPVVCCIRKHRQYPRTRGTTSFGRTEWNPLLIEYALKLLRALRWKGVGSIEFKLSPAGVPYFIELNPRLPWYNHLFAVSGVNLPALMYEDLADSEGGGAELPRQRDGVAWGHLANDFASHRAARPRPGAGAWIRWAIAHLSARASAWRCLSDPIPGLTAYAALFRSLRTPPAARE